jgi:Holliday junction resolvasome RuvABC endonuclease subunit
MVKLSLINSKPKTVCSIDASTNSLAFAIFEDKSLIRFGKISFTGRNTYEKVGDAAKKCLAFFKQFNIDSIIIEHTVFINSPKTAADLALVQGAMLGSAQINGIKIAGSVNPITWQSFIGNTKLSAVEKQQLRKENSNKSESWYKGQEREIRKQKTIRYVSTYYNKSISDNDVADAIGIGHWAIHNWEKVDK